MRCQLAASAVAASWRLGRWELLDRYLAVAEGAGPELLDSSDRWEVRLGQLMGAVARKEPAAVEKQVSRAPIRHVVCSPGSMLTCKWSSSNFNTLLNWKCRGWSTAELRFGDSNPAQSTVRREIASVF